jgi:hypothetical protein
MVDEIRALVESGVKKVYIAIIPDLDGFYGLEVEINEGTIGFTHETDTRSLELAREQADLLETLLTDVGIKVFYTRAEWEASQ